MLDKFDLLPHSPLGCTTGDKFGRLTVLTTGKEKYQYYAICNCDCGNGPIVVKVSRLRNKTTQSCGCFQKDVTTKHGNWGHRLYSIWRNMHARCYKTNNKRYNRYGGRGIFVCEQWHDLNVFINDMHPSFVEGLELDRIDNDKDYSVENCRWTNKYTQNRNYSKNVNITHNGKTQCLTDWAIELGIVVGTLWDRIKVREWSTEKALTTPVIKKVNRIIKEQNT